jgi:hypothetical protein
MKQNKRVANNNKRDHNDTSKHTVASAAHVINHQIPAPRSAPHLAFLPCPASIPSHPELGCAAMFPPLCISPKHSLGGGLDAVTPP